MAMLACVNYVNMQNIILVDLQVVRVIQLVSQASWQIYKQCIRQNWQFTVFGKNFGIFCLFIAAIVNIDSSNQGK